MPHLKEFQVGSVAPFPSALVSFLRAPESGTTLIDDIDPLLRGRGALDRPQDKINPERGKTVTACGTSNGKTFDSLLWRGSFCHVMGQVCPDGTVRLPMSWTACSNLQGS